MRTEKDWTEIEKKTVTLVKKTFARELAIRRQKPYEFLKERLMIGEFHNLNKMLDGKNGCSILTLARIADAFGYDIELKRRNDDENFD